MSGGGSLPWAAGGGGGGGATDLDGLSDVAITASATGDWLRYNGTSYVDVPKAQHLTDLLTLGTGTASADTILYGDGSWALPELIVSKAGSTVGVRPKINLIEGTNISLTVTENVGADRIDIEVAAAGSGGLTPPLAADFPTVVGAGQTVTDGERSLVLRATALGAAFDVQMRLRAYPGSTPFTRVMKISFDPIKKSFHQVGWVVRDSSTGRFFFWMLQSGGTFMQDFTAQSFTNATTRNAFDAALECIPGPIWLKFQDTGTNHVVSLSHTGDDDSWYQVDSRGRTSWVATPDQMGFASNAYNNAATNTDAVMAIEHYEAV